MKGRNVVLVWVGGGDFICERTVHIWHFFGLGHSRFHLYAHGRGVEKSYERTPFENLLQNGEQQHQQHKGFEKTISRIS